jgi:hypothetical protein
VERLGERALVEEVGEVRRRHHRDGGVHEEHAGQADDEQDLEPPVVGGVRASRDLGGGRCPGRAAVVRRVADAHAEET